MFYGVETDLEKYLAEAERCEKVAGECMSPANRQAYLKLAKQWRALARDAGRPFHAPYGASNDDVRETISAAK